ncbi:L-asparagine oxygenase [Streptomyces olivochromogenes]|uniref:L-asparagine oxygenase n=2 Tax=Streptomyces olivochromogenes TaxID=1963 RepID=A0A250VSB0_STROL|nr:TauD/TfdA family dioxygenase [Streptomyces olivochromogenes]GAX57097.1 L-asparagine oxygenase [Streptomyces olivochromogenes]
MGTGRSVHMSCGEWRDGLDDLLVALPAVPRHDVTAFARAAAKMAAELPGPLLERLKALRTGQDGHGYLHVTDLPCAPGALPSTPDSRPAPLERPLLAMEGWLLAICTAMGVPTAYRELHSGSLIQDIYPSPNAHPLSAQSSTTALTLHSEMLYHRWRPDFLLLACSRADHDGAAGTTVAAARAALPLLGAAEREILREHRMTCGTDLAFRHTDGSSPQAHVLVVDGVPADPRLAFDRELLEPGDPSARRALQALSEALDEVTDTVRMRPGDLLILDNTRVVHGRTAFTPRWDGHDRWLHRTYARSLPRGPAGAEAAFPYQTKPFAPR